jgi:hypothetical protein
MFGRFSPAFTAAVFYTAVIFTAVLFTAVSALRIPLHSRSLVFRQGCGEGLGEGLTAVSALGALVPPRGASDNHTALNHLIREQAL